MRRALLLAALLGGGCGDDDDESCGNLLDAGSEGVTLAVESMTFTFGDFGGEMARDCGMESVTVTGHQLVPAPASTFRLAFCLPDRRDVGQDPLPLTEAMNFFVAAEMPGGCTFANDQGQAPAGTFTLAGFCAAGGMPFSLAFDATIPGTSSCPVDGGSPVQAPATLVLSGAAAVTAF